MSRVSSSIRFCPMEVSRASPTLMPIVRVICSMALATPYAPAPAASTAAVARGDTVRPKPAPKIARSRTSRSRSVSTPQPSANHRPTALIATPRTVTIRSPTHA